MAAHPELHPRSPDRDSDRRHLAEKLAVADFGITQFFFDVDDYVRMIDELDALGCTTPVLPGIMPTVNVAGLRRMAGMNGTELPAPMMERLDAVADDEAEVAKIGVEVASELAAALLRRGCSRPAPLRDEPVELGPGRARQPPPGLSPLGAGQPHRRNSGRMVRSSVEGEVGRMADDASDAQDRAASILRDGLDIWTTQGKRLHDRSTEKSMWSPEDIIGDATDLMEHLTPLVERTIVLGLDLLRPWAVKIEERTSGE